VAFSFSAYSEAPFAVGVLSIVEDATASATGTATTSTVTAIGVANPEVTVSVTASVSGTARNIATPTASVSVTASVPNSSAIAVAEIDDEPFLISSTANVAATAGSIAEIDDETVAISSTAVVSGTAVGIVEVDDEVTNISGSGVVSDSTARAVANATLEGAVGSAVSTSTAVAIANGVLDEIQASALSTSTVRAVANVQSTVSGTAVSTSTARAVANTVLDSVSGLSVNSSTATGVANQEGSATGTSSIASSGIQEDVNNMSVSGTASLSGTARTVDNLENLDITSADTVVSPVSARSIANPSSEVLSSAIVVGADIRHIHVLDTEVQEISSIAVTAAIGHLQSFFDPALYTRASTVYVLQEEKRSVSVEPDPENQSRLILVDSPEYRTVQVAA